MEEREDAKIFVLLMGLETFYKEKLLLYKFHRYFLYQISLVFILSYKLSSCILVLNKEKCSQRVCESCEVKAVCSDKFVEYEMHARHSKYKITPSSC